MLIHFVDYLTRPLAIESRTEALKDVTDYLLPIEYH